MTSDRIGIIEAINHPLGFFALALMIIEIFLGTVLIFSDLDQNQKYMGMWAGLVLFIIVITIVFILVWYKPKNLTFGEEAHLRDDYGTETSTVSRKELEESEKIDLEDVWEAL